MLTQKMVEFFEEFPGCTRLSQSTFCTSMFNLHTYRKSVCLYMDADNSGSFKLTATKSACLFLMTQKKHVYIDFATRIIKPQSWHKSGVTIYDMMENLNINHD